MYLLTKTGEPKNPAPREMCDQAAGSSSASIS